jgi:GDP-L-fucose synthase
MRILVTGGTGMVGRHLKELMPTATYVGSQDCDLKDYKQTQELIDKHSPDIVIHLAAKVGGIVDNIQRPAEYYDDNMLINFNILKASRERKVSRFIGILSTCVYPDKLPTYPMVEEDLFLGPPTATNFGYGYAKRCLAVQIGAYNKQYETKYNYIIPCNLYSEYDNFDHQEKMHFVTALLKKINDAKDGEVLNLLGTGKPLRQFMYAGDLALVIKMMVDGEVYENLNICTEENLSIDEMAKIGLKISNKNLKIEYTNTTDGQFRKDVSNEKMLKYFPEFKFTPFEVGIEKVYNSIKNG